MPYSDGVIEAGAEDSSSGSGEFEPLEYTAEEPSLHQSLGSAIYKHSFENGRRWLSPSHPFVLSQICSSQSTSFRQVSLLSKWKIPDTQRRHRADPRRHEACPPAGAHQRTTDPCPHRKQPTKDHRYRNRNRYGTPDQRHCSCLILTPPRHLGSRRSAETERRSIRVRCETC